MAYANDIFISYKRGTEINRWITSHFQPLLEHAVELELGRKPTIYRDDKLDDGGTWPLELGRALGESRVLVCLWTRAYFHSEWCVHELAAMLARERSLGFRTPNKPDGLVIPNVLHDCESLPSELAPIQQRRLHDSFNVRMSRDSRRSEQLAEELEQAAPGIVRAIWNAPEWQQEWPEETAASFIELFYRSSAPRQTALPGFAS